MGAYWIRRGLFEHRWRVVGLRPRTNAGVKETRTSKNSLWLLNARRPPGGRPRRPDGRQPCGLVKGLRLRAFDETVAG
jgi:hypothetical protein